MATAAAILDSTILVDSLVEELLCTWHVTAEEATDIKRIVDQWGDEPADHRPQASLRAEIAGRIHDYLLAKRAPAITRVMQ